MESEQDPIAEFKAIAGRYVALIEDDSALAERRVISGLAELLPALYVAALRLPDVPALSGHVPDSLITTHQQQEMYRRLAQLVGDEKRQDWRL